VEPRREPLEDAVTPERLRARLAAHPGRGGCGVGAVADLKGRALHEHVETAIRGLGCLEHRGGALEDTGDGAGLLLTTDDAFFARFIAPGRSLPEGHHLAVGVFFFPHGERQNLTHWQHEIDAMLRRAGLAPLGWRKVPVDESALGRSARETRREVWQALVGEGMLAREDLPGALWRVKAQVEARIRDVYVASLSPSTLVYKALATGDQLRRYYGDLRDPDLRASAVVFHRRYSTNTFSNWTLAQVFRVLCHNGEINTIKANRNAVQNLEAELGLGPILMAQGSDSADLDRVVELFVSHGVPLLETLCRLMPAAHREVPGLTPEARRWFEGVQRALGSLGAWEGPAAIVAMDGRTLVGALDRMGLRPLRWAITRDDRFILGSELGSIPVPPGDLLETGQLEPGEQIALDLRDRTLVRPREVMARVLSETKVNFRELVESRITPLPRAPSAAPAPAPAPTPAPAPAASLVAVGASVATPAPLPAAPAPAAAPSVTAAPAYDHQALNLFGWTPERIRNARLMAENAKEPITSMGYDRPLAALSMLRPPLAKYMKQIVAVVTNPPIDPIREGGAFDLTVHLGASPSVQEESPVYGPRPQWRAPSPFLTSDQMERLLAPGSDGIERPKALVLDASFEDPANGAASGSKAISRRIAEVVRAGSAAIARGEASILVLSDRASLERADRLPLPAILVTSALHNALVGEGRRRRASIVVETGEVQEGHDGAALIANGATAVYPYLYYQVGATAGTVASLAAALDESLRRVMSKMGICSTDGYRGSRLFEAVGLAPEIVEYYLPGVVSRLGGLTLGDLYEDLRARRALGAKPQRDAEVSIYRKEVWNELQTTARGHDPESWTRFTRLLEETPPVYLRDLLRLRPAGPPLPLEEVASEREVAAACLRGAAMSHGALHRVAHRAIAAAFNALGAASNCGEGGEDPRRDRGGVWETSRSRIRQVASGRFGVDARYLASADEVSIKIGQGAKPGEGGMLPAPKVTAEVAMIRKTQQGVALISPPPHHDIYSIEDLAQLIYDLRQANPRARVSVKIPAVTDIGTIAVGIAKAGADVIDISGFEGGTGAAAASSIEHAGLPLERALSEAHQALVVAGVRRRVRLRVDGGLKSGFDIVAVLALGADECSLGTALMIAEQCIFCHGCANGFCPAGITTQSDLVARRLMTVKKGRPKDEALPDEEEERYEDARNAVGRYLSALGRDVRARLAAIGVRRPEDLVGRVDLLERRPPSGHARADRIDLAEVLVDPREAAGLERERPAGFLPSARLPVDPTSELNARICAAAALGRASLEAVVSSTDRAIGATLAGKVAAGEVALPPGGFEVRLEGYAGQALGFACVEGIRIALEGFANDKVAEAMGGGTVAIRPPAALPEDARGALSLVGNAACYGATGGRLFVAGRAGQRVGVRNSGAAIVVEGAGKYAFEYMTGGVGVVLGPVGVVVGSGLTGGALYILDEAGDLSARVHASLRVAPLDDSDAAALRALVEGHARETGSPKARALLERWDEARARFRKVTA
jgi:glutamate synthase domain-containing protein 2/glutamate synthase domain-containing protein 1/glutamate synthase domain-containing protein 3